MRGQYFSPKKLESLAEALLVRYERETKTSLQPPISAESIAESIGLGILWDDIPEEPGTTTCGMLIPERRLIVLNQRRLSLFEEKPELENTTIGHELGHWCLHVDHNESGSLSLPEVTYDSTPAPESGRDRWDERNAHQFMGYLLMPSRLLLPRLEDLNLRDWRHLYRLRETFNVTISALRIRLEKLDLTYLDIEGEFHKSKQQAQGQNPLF